MKRMIIYIIAALCLALPMAVNAEERAQAQPPQETVQEGKLTYYRAQILDIQEKADSSLNAVMFQGQQVIKVKIRNKDLKGQEVEIVTPIMQNSAFEVDYHIGDQVIVFTDEAHPDRGFTVFDHYRMTWVYYLVLLFIAIVLVIGRKAGAKSLLSMGSSIVMILIMLPFVIKGYHPIKLAIVLAIINTVFTLLMIGGCRKKSVAAILGTIMGILVAFALVRIFGPRSYITGLSNESALMLLYLPKPLSPKDVIYASMILGSLGAVMDVTMSIASSVEEISKANPDMTFGALYRSGMNVGRDIMGTMSNTLVLAYFASALPLAIIIFSYNADMPYFYNMDLFVTEIVRLITGSIGLVLTIPATCLISSVFYQKRKPLLAEEKQ